MNSSNGIVLDSSGTPTPGFMFGNSHWLGSLTECEDINLKPQGGRKSPLQSHYLVANFRHNATTQELTGLNLEVSDINLHFSTPLHFSDHLNNKLNYWLLYNCTLGGTVALGCCGLNVQEMLR